MIGLQQKMNDALIIQKIGRWKFFVLNLFAYTIVVILYLSALYAPPLLDYQLSIPYLIIAVSLFVNVIALLSISTIQRLRDIGWPPYWAVLVMVPYLNLGLFILLSWKNASV